MTDKIDITDLTPLQAAEILRHAAKNVRNEPASLDLDFWGTTSVVIADPDIREESGCPYVRADYVAEMVAPSCGTTACVAGHISWEASRIVDAGVLSIPEMAEEVLRIAGSSRFVEEWCDMFSYTASFWPATLQDRAAEVGEADAVAEWLEGIADAVEVRG